MPPPVLAQIKLIDIHDDAEFNCRGMDLKATDVIDLARDIEINGLIQPVIVRKYTDAERQETGKRYKLIAGFRRLKAHQVLNRPVMDCLIRSDMDNEVDARCFNLAENIVRADLNILQEARAIDALRQRGMNLEALAAKLGKSPGWVQLRLTLLKLPEPIQEEAAAGIIKQLDIRELFKTQKKLGTDACYEYARSIKDARIKGNKPKDTMNKKLRKAKTAKLVRSKGEINEMLDHICTHLGPGLWTRALAWAAGNITNGEFHMDLAEFARVSGKSYVLPNDPKIKEEDKSPLDKYYDELKTEE